jgi:hypothetical protein
VLIELSPGKFRLRNNPLFSCEKLLLNQAELAGMSKDLVAVSSLEAVVQPNNAKTIKKIILDLFIVSILFKNLSNRWIYYALENPETKQ